MLGEHRSALCSAGCQTSHKDMGVALGCSVGDLKQRLSPGADNNLEGVLEPEHG